MDLAEPRPAADSDDAVAEGADASESVAASEIDRSRLDTSFVEQDAQPVRLLRRISGGREPGFVVVVQRSVLEAVHAHGQSDTGVEICGVLVGEVRHDRISPYLLIESHIPGDKAASKQTQVTFTAETWQAIQSKMESDHPDKKVVGWYHTHPGFGVFLSGMDLFIQDNFFNFPWQVAWVYDPIAQTDGAFVWRAGKSEQTEFLVEENMGERGHDFRAALPESGRPVIPVPRSRASSITLMSTTIATFIACFLASWFLLQWASSNGYRVRLPLDW